MKIFAKKFIKFYDHYHCKLSHGHFLIWFKKWGIKFLNMKMSWIDSGNSVGKLKNKNFNIGIFVQNPYVELCTSCKNEKNSWGKLWQSNSTKELVYRPHVDFVPAKKYKKYSGGILLSCRRLSMVRESERRKVESTYHDMYLWQPDIGEFVTGDKTLPTSGCGRSEWEIREWEKNRWVHLIWHVPMTARRRPIFDRRQKVADVWPWSIIVL